MKTLYLESFPTIDLCVAFLDAMGCKWNYEKEQKLKRTGSYRYQDTIVFYDPYNLIEK